MKYILGIFAAIILVSCSNTEDEYHKPENALDAGREFIQESLKGKFKTANQYMLQDEENQYWLAKWSKEFNKISEQEKASFSKASINIAEVNDVVPDSVTVINFSNSYKKNTSKVKSSKVQWGVESGF